MTALPLGACTFQQGPSQPSFLVLGLHYTTFAFHGGPLETVRSRHILVPVDTQKDIQSPKQEPMICICEDCHTENEIKSRDQIKCRECGHRMMCKTRTKRLVGFDAP
ncbi:DNA-directed RNA polymerases I, II, and III subunit RPABC4-like [Rousettus aegyptiacus]|uniref:DNA-directed RNA polymerases I, II, and III subunit RPABC4-like n=1 Tax=Rousettus aegyptiacus TaxID=9407 RepID=UPI00168CE779|nr:DNA-directed RNA polymerases I, II, and III subunit RPABC4-like [Rousettus aegyptiacus]